MLFQIAHTHTIENCPAQSQERVKRVDEWWKSFKKTTGVRVLAAYSSPIDHTWYFTVEADDYSVLARALGPLNTYGAGRICPVITFEQSLPMAKAGKFRTSK